MTGTSKEFTDLIVAANVAIGNEEVARIGLCNCSCDHVRTAYELLNDSLATVSNANVDYTSPHKSSNILQQKDIHCY